MKERIKKGVGIRVCVLACVGVNMERKKSYIGEMRA